MSEAAAARPGLLDRLLRLFSDVRAGEAASVLLLMANVFAIQVGYYVIKTVREPLVLAEGGAEVKSYASAGQALLLMGFVPLYGWISSRVDRMALITAVTLFFMANIEVFSLGASLRWPYIGVAFFVWAGIFNNAVVAQFWSYANDIYERPVGERLFPVIAIGSVVGPPVGARLVEALYDRELQPHAMLHVSTGLLLVSLLLFHLAERQEGRRAAKAAEGSLARGPGGFALILRSRYLRLIGLLLIVLNLVNTTGNYILDTSLLAAADAAAASGVDRGTFIGVFYSRFYFWQNVLTFGLQAFVASRLVRYAGMAGLVLALPVVATGAYGLVAVGAGFAVLRWAKIAENATDYSIMNTARATLWLPTSREEKYKAKQAVDTFLVRAGDVLSALFVYGGTTVVGMGVRGFAGLNLVLIALWVSVAVLLLREHRRLTAPAARPAA